MKPRKDSAARAALRSISRDAGRRRVAERLPGGASSAPAPLIAVSVETVRAPATEDAATDSLYTDEILATDEDDEDDDEEN